MLALAYAALAALLLALNLKTPYARPIKLAGIALVTLFYIFAYHGSQNMRGWAIADAPPNPFKLHWAVIEEPDKIAKTPARYICWRKNCRIMVRCSLSALYRLPFRWNWPMRWKTRSRPWKAASRLKAG